MQEKAVLEIVHKRTGTKFVREVTRLVLPDGGRFEDLRDLAAWQYGENMCSCQVWELVDPALEDAECAEVATEWLLKLTQDGEVLREA